MASPFRAHGNALPQTLLISTVTLAETNSYEH